MTVNNNNADSNNKTHEAVEKEEIQEEPLLDDDDDDDDDDPALELIWLVDDGLGGGTAGNHVLTQEGLERIVHHKYVPGTYTWLDNLCNPFWTTVTEYVPLWLAPNVLTLLGALHCLLSYTVTWYYAPQALEAVPAWLLIFNAYCLFVAYTLDCMDGKQARRTRTSSPLGQLLDHGLDCLCVLAHVAGVQAWLRAGDTLRLQMILQLTFYLAQWEEFFTGHLPHSAGPIGVTEVNYALAALSLWHGTVWASATTNPERGLYQVPITDDVQWLMQQGVVTQPLLDDKLSALTGQTMNDVMALLEGWQRRHVILFSWITSLSIICALMVLRVMMNLPSWKHRFTALCQLATPVFLMVLALVDEFSSSEDFVQNQAHIRTTIRWKSLAIGLLYCHITIKVIVFSMARQAMAVLQWDALPLLPAIAFTVYDPRLHAAGHVLIWQTLALYWGSRLWSWSSTATQQICHRLHIKVWTIPHPHQK